MKQASNWKQIQQLRNSLIVSCQADEGEPLEAKEQINALALSAIKGGARGLRLEGLDNIQYVRRHTQMPIIGLIKSAHVGTTERVNRVYITDTADGARAIGAAGADIVALDATGRPRSDGSSLKQMIDIVHDELKKPVWADIATVEEASLALRLGADVISTTLYGYTAETQVPPEAPPSFDLLLKICEISERPVVLEGRVWEPAEVKRAFECGVWAVVVGSAITRPTLITRRFVESFSKTVSTKI